MNEDQKAKFQRFNRAIANRNNVQELKIFFLDAPGGTGKTYIFNALLCKWRAGTYPFTFKRRQLPIKLAFAMIINKAQGQSLEHVGSTGSCFRSRTIVALLRSGVPVYQQTLSY